MATKTSSFSQRVAGLVGGGVVSDMAPNETTAWALAVENQFLVSSSITEAVFASMLSGLSSPVTGLKHEGNVFGSLVADSDQVDIYAASIPAAYPHNVFSVVDELRASMRKGSTIAELGQISPNHVLVPASEAAFCPWGPPHPHFPPEGVRTTLPEAATPVVPVTVIDVGYQWNDRSWKRNPLGSRLVQLIEVGAPDVADWSTAPGANMSPETTKPGGPLVALAGHANFVAGIIAQTCAHAEITIINLNGAYGEAAVDMLPTEATLANAILAHAGAARIVNVSLACVAHTDPVTEAPIPAPVWAGVFNKLAADDVVVVAPVGNQGSVVARFPAALGIGGAFLAGGPPYQYEGATNLYPQMIGVASSTSAEDGEGELVAYSNIGQWVTASVDGSNIVSTFLDIKQELEDDVPGSPARDFTTSGGWASWSGTCFASAKMTGLIAEQIAAAAAPIKSLDAWTHVYQQGAFDAANMHGMVVPG